MIPRSFIEQLVNRMEIEDVISSYVQIKRAGRNPKGLCPFHSEKSPSFTLYPETQSFYCFGCGAGGDVVNFIMRIENLDYPEAVRFLAKRAGMEVPEDGSDEVSDLKAKVLQINRETAMFFHRCLKSPAGQEGYAYLHDKRALSDKVIATFGLGFAPNSWTSLTDHLRGKGYTEQELLAAAVATRGKNGNCYDLFRNRVMFPIIDLRGSVIAFGGRVLDDSKPKYLNSPDTPVFKKSRNLFALNFAKNAVKDKLILAEGYMDVISIHAAGFPTAIATLGTSLTEEQARLMSKYAKSVVIAYDSDGAGQAATHRAINLLSDAGISAKVLRMDGAKDPDEYIKKFGATRFQLLLDGAADVISHELGGIRSKVDMGTSEGKIEYLKKAVGVLADLRNPLEREVYAAQIAKETGIMAEAVVSQTDALMKKKYQQREKKEWREIESGKTQYLDKINPDKALNRREAVAEEGIISFLLKNPDCYKDLLAKISTGDFVTAFNRKVVEAMLALHVAGGDVNVTTLGGMLSPDEVRGVAGIIARTSEAPVTKEMFGDYIDTLVEHKHSLDITKPAEITPESGEEFRKRMSQKKKKL